MDDGILLGRISELELECDLELQHGIGRSLHNRQDILRVTRAETLLAQAFEDFLLLLVRVVFYLLTLACAGSFRYSLRGLHVQKSASHHRHGRRNRTSRPSE